MEELKKILKIQNVDYDIGIINNGIYHKLSEPFDNEQVVRFKWKKNSINKLIIKLKNKNINLMEVSSNLYSALYNIVGTNNKVFIIYAVDSHVQIPKSMLKYFRTGNYLYYISTLNKNNKINRSSARRYNTKFGYYSLYFEEYLSKNYESIIVDIINTILPFVERKETIITFENLEEKVNKLFLMSLFRNPKYVEEINNYSVFSQIIDGGYTPEYIAYVGEETNKNYIKGYTPVVLINETDRGMLTIKSLFSNLRIDGGVKCMLIPLHPKFAIALVPNEYYKKMIEEQGEQTYLKLNEDKELLQLNKQLYLFAKNNNDDVIGLKNDLDELVKI